MAQTPPRIDDLKAEITHYHDVYEKFGAHEGAKALRRVLDMLDEHYEHPDRMPMQLVFRELAEARSMTR